MKKGSGVSPSSLAAIVAAIVVGTAVTVQDIRARQAVERHDTPEAAMAAPRLYATDAQPSAMLPGFNPDRDIDRIQQLVAGGPKPTHHTQAPNHPPVQKRQPPVQRDAGQKQVAAVPHQEVVGTHPRLSFEDMEALQRYILAYNEPDHPSPPRPFNSTTPAGKPKVDTPTTVAAYLVAEPQGVSLLLYTKDSHGQTRHKLELSEDLGLRLEQNVAEGKAGTTLLMIERLYAPRTDAH